jgi:hypothetical protein
MSYTESQIAISSRDVEELMLECGLHVDHTTVFRWVQCDAPELDKRSRPSLKTTNDSYRVDETAITIKKVWHDLSRAVDAESNGSALHVMLANRFHATVDQNTHQEEDAMPWPHKRGTAPRRPQGESPGDSSRPLDTHTAPTADASPRPSKSQRKREAHALQALGAQLVALPRAHLARMALPDALREAVLTAQGMRPHGARTRHMQYLGKLMRQLDPAVLRMVREALAPKRAVMPRPQPEPEGLVGPMTGEV